eukprot:scaffold98_cov307-Prasinococcus_capsulatus_cf.AAC.8
MHAPPPHARPPTATARAGCAGREVPARGHCGGDRGARWVCLQPGTCTRPQRPGSRARLSSLTARRRARDAAPQRPPLRRTCGCAGKCGAVARERARVLHGAPGRPPTASSSRCRSTRSTRRAPPCTTAPWCPTTWTSHGSGPTTWIALGGLPSPKGGVSATDPAPWTLAVAL